MDIQTKSIIDDGENGTIEEVLIAPVGTFIGSSKEGEPVEQTFTEEALVSIAEDLNNSGKEILLDKDHASVREGNERDTQSLGWFSQFKASVKGLFAKLKLTKTGRDMIENKEYRRVSPVFQLNEENTPVQLVSVAATNTPAIDIPENIILNNSAVVKQTKESETEQKESDPESPNKEEVTNMTIEEIKKLIRDTFAEIKAEEEEAKKNEAKETKETEVKENIDETKEEVKSQCSETKSEIPVEKTGKEKPVTDDDDVEDEKEEMIEKQKKEEVLKEEVLNQTSIPSPKKEWENLHGEAFFDWVRKNPDKV